MNKRSLWKLTAGLQELNALLEKKGIWKIGTILNGVILKKAELENNFTAVYSTVIDRVDRLEKIEDDEFLFILGDVGG